MKNKKYITIPELAKLWGMSRIAVYQKVKKGQIKSIRIGRNYAIPVEESDLVNKQLNDEDKKRIGNAVKKTVKEYSEALRKLGNE